MPQRSTNSFQLCAGAYGNPERGWTQRAGRSTTASVTERCVLASESSLRHSLRRQSRLGLCRFRYYVSDSSSFLAIVLDVREDSLDVVGDLRAVCLRRVGICITQNVDANYLLAWAVCFGPARALLSFPAHTQSSARAKKKGKRESRPCGLDARLPFSRDRWRGSQSRPRLTSSYGVYATGQVVTPKKNLHRFSDSAHLTSLPSLRVILVSTCGNLVPSPCGGSCCHNRITVEWATSD